VAQSISLLVVVLLALVPSRHSQQADEGIIRVMTYNIRFAGDEQVEGINAWSKRKSLVASMIRFHRAEIVGLQEALKLQLDDLVDLLPDYAWVGVGRDDGAEGGEFSAIFFNRKRFEILNHSTFWLSDTPEKPSKGWDAAFPRVVTWAKMKDTQTDRTFYLFNTHLDHRGKQARLQSVVLLKNKVAELAGELPVIITGDFNFRPESEEYKIITENSRGDFADAMVVSRYEHHGSYVTFNDFGRSIVDGNRIDYIFVRNGVGVVQHGILADTFEGRFPSDHMPVVADVRIP
jgi:endonuclease/exonuclease/phosphatase family metal-dependent hydrolase